MEEKTPKVLTFSLCEIIIIYYRHMQFIKARKQHKVAVTNRQIICWVFIKYEGKSLMEI